MQIETERLVLRPVRLTDHEALTTLLQDERVHPWVREDGAPTEAQVRRWIAGKMLGWAQGSSATWAIDRGDQLVGYVALFALDRPVQAIAYAVAPDHWRQGIAREALSAVLEHAPQLGMREVWARTHHENPPSAALLEALGFEEREPIVAPARRTFVWKLPR